MRILFLTSGHGSSNGIAIATRNLVNELNQRREVHADILSYWPWEDPTFILERNKKKESLRNLYDFINLKLKYDLFIFQNYIFSDIFLKLIPQNPTLEQFLSNYPIPKIYVSHSLAIRSLLPEKDVFDIHHFDAEKQLMSYVDKIIHLTPEQNELAAKLYPTFFQKCTIIGNGVPLLRISKKEVKRLRSKLGPELGLFLGRISPEKGIIELAKSLPKIKKHKPSFKLIFAGNKKDAAELQLRKCLQKIGLIEDKDYQFMGWVNGTEKIKLIHAVDFVVLPSHWEHLPLTALETMACGTPLIISDTLGPNGEFKLNKRDCLALAVKPKDHLALSETIIWALQNKIELGNMCRRAQRAVKSKYTIHKVASKYLKLARQIRNFY